MLGGDKMTIELEVSPSCWPLLMYGLRRCLYPRPSARLCAAAAAVTKTIGSTDTNCNIQPHPSRSRIGLGTLVTTRSGSARNRGAGTDACVDEGLQGQE